jgi:hypothetical protein
LNFSQVASNSATADCYIDYTGSISQDWILTYQDGDDQDGNCSTMNLAPSTTSTEVTATVSPTAGSCSGTLSMHVSVQSNPQTGPHVVSIAFNGSGNVTDQSDNYQNFNESFVVTMNVHIGSCPPAATSSDALAATRARHPAKVTYTRRPQVGTIALIDFTIVPVTSSSPPCPPLPAPTIAKSLYRASLESHVRLEFTDSADSSAGTLTWVSAGKTSTFKNVKFDQDTTDQPPHANTLAFDVPVNTPPADYPINVSVKSDSGQQSSDTIVTLRVLPVVSYETTLNSAGVFEQDTSGVIIVSDGSTFQTDDDGQESDFPLSGMGTSSIIRKPQQVIQDGPFDPLNPPGPLANKIAALANTKRLGCVSVLDDSNVGSDRTSGTSQGTLTIFAYCDFTDVSFGAMLRQYGADYETSAITERLPATQLPVLNMLGTYNGFHVSSSDAFPITPVTRHAERMTARYSLFYGSPVSKQTTVQNGEGIYDINNNGVFYPKITMGPFWAVPAVLAAGHGYVPFPSPPFRRCLAGNPNCVTNRSQLKANLLAAGLPNPPTNYQAHHIRPVAWCGQNDVTNGVFLPTNYGEYNLHGPFNEWWSIDKFKPSDSVENC